MYGGILGDQYQTIISVDFNYFVLHQILKPNSVFHRIGI